MLTRHFKNACALTLLGVFANAQATTTEPMALSDATSASSAIVVAELVTTDTHMMGNTPMTTVTLSVTDQLKGNSSDTISISIPGGTFSSGGLTLTEIVPGLSPLMFSEKGIYFLNDADADGTFDIVGFNQGMMQIRDIDGEQMMIGTLTDGKMMSLDEMKQRIDEVE